MTINTCRRLMRREILLDDAGHKMTELVLEVRKIALYYPYIHIRDDNWLKAAALYWPRIARLAPPAILTRLRGCAGPAG
jgi:hypothetical protein